MIKIHWFESHDRGDYNIASQLESGGDEGPLLLLGVEFQIGRQRPGLIAVFRDVDSYLASIVGDDDNQIRERWIGLVRGSEQNNGEVAVAALQRLENILAPKPKKEIPISRKSSSRHTEIKPLYASLTDRIEFAGAITIENGGPAFDDVARYYPRLLSHMSL